MVSTLESEILPVAEVEIVRVPERVSQEESESASDWEDIVEVEEPMHHHIIIIHSLAAWGFHERRVRDTTHN